ncbi:HAD-IC family P-type ATPase [Candidatus Babeliales bacterium]|nr:HAD-IC family P-type ATPase [Candidatus Babeliales bacterium]
MNAYLKDIDQIVSSLSTNLKNGLEGTEAKKRLKEVGMNAIPVKSSDSYLKIFISQFKNPLIYILIAAAVIIFFLEHKTDAFFITFVLLLNAVVGTYQEGRSGNIVDRLKKLMHTSSVVIRDGKKHILESTELVPGDLIALQEGDQIPADARLVSVNNLYVDESSLTGESFPVIKTIEKFDKELSYSEQTNMIFSGSYVTEGSAFAIVTATGILTVMGRLKGVIEKVDTKIPLLKNIERIAYAILWGVAFICIALFIVGFFTGQDLKSLLTMLTALFICVVPEGLPVIVTLVLAMGVARMAKKQVLVKRLAAVEGLGQVNVIAIDKTGTLTKNKMIVDKVIVDEKILEIEEVKDKKNLGLAAALLSSVQIDQSKRGVRIKGDPTEAALTHFGEIFGFTKTEIEKKLDLFKEIPFNHEHKIKAVIFRGNLPETSLTSDTVQVFVLGAPESIDNFLDNSLSAQTKDNLKSLSNEGFRVLSLANKTLNLDEWKEYNHKYFKNGATEGFYKDALNNLSFSCIYGIQDELREGVNETVKYAKDSGIHVVMITGDYLNTANGMAKKSGILKEGELSAIGSDLYQISNEDLERTTVFARVLPQEKLEVIQMFRRTGHVVAMTGDGVNDVPSLAAADLGISMGQIGTEIAKEASDIILLDDSFGSIVEAIEEGRHIFNTLKKVILYFFSTNAAEILIVIFAMILGFPLPLLAIQILWLNLVTDGFLDLALSMEPKGELALKKIPPKKGKMLVDKSLIIRMLFMSIPMALISLYIFNFYIKDGEIKARTMALITMAILQLFNVWNCRSNKDSIVTGFFKNKYLLASSIFVFLLQLIIVHMKPMQVLFRTVRLNFFDWFLILLAASVIVWVEELRKFFLRNKTT